MSHIERNTNYLNKHRVVYRQTPITDLPSFKHKYYDFYEEGTYQCYELFRSRAKITTFKSLKWHLLVLWYLNPSWDMEMFEKISFFISDKPNGFITFNISEKFLTNMIYEISMLDLDTPPKNKKRKVIFKDGTKLETSEKLRIVGSLIGRSKKVSPDDIYQCMLEINDENKKITITRLGKILKCSNRTIYRNLPHELKKEKELLNKQVTN
jgi:hypothetical protein